VLLPDAVRMREALDRAGWSVESLDELLGITARTHLDRDELAPVLRRTRDGSALATIARLFVAGVAATPEAARKAGVPASWLRPDGTAAVRLQAVSVGGVEVTVAHDAGRAATGVHPEQVLGVGAASLTLAAATPRRTVRRTLDLGTGCGIQALLAEDHSGVVVASDRNPRAVSLARLGAALGAVDLDVRAGDFLDPVAGEEFDLVVSNPPFVVSPGARYTYRDAGLDGDEVCRRLVRDLPAVLAPEGIAVLLVNWLHVEGEDGDARVRGWFEGTGCDGWVVQRELAAPEDYVTAWLRDTDEGPRFDELYDEWLDWFERRRVEAVAFGVVAMRRRTSGSASVVLDDVTQPVAPAWGEEVLAHFVRRDALASDVLDTDLLDTDLLDTDLLDTHLLDTHLLDTHLLDTHLHTHLLDKAWRLRDDVRLHQVASRDDEGWLVDSQLLQQSEGLRWSGGTDEHGAALLAACDGTVPLRTLFRLLAAGAGITEGEAVETGLPVVRRLVEQGFLVP
jgi:methylase of polypeptide subunit release factors